MEIGIKKLSWFCFLQFYLFKCKRINGYNDKISYIYFDSIINHSCTFDMFAQVTLNVRPSSVIALESMVDTLSVKKSYPRWEILPCCHYKEDQDR